MSSHEEKVSAAQDRLTRRAENPRTEKGLAKDLRLVLDALTAAQSRLLLASRGDDHA